MAANTPSPEEIAAVFEQPGGCRQIQYRDMTIVAPLNDIKHAIDQLRQLSRSRRRRVLHSVNNTLAKSYEMRNHFDYQQAMDFAQDVAIWFANEVAEGRAEL